MDRFCVRTPRARQVVSLPPEAEALVPLKENLMNAKSADARLAALDALKTVTISASTLKALKLGKCVRRLYRRSVSGSRVCAAARALLDGWATLVSASVDRIKPATPASSKRKRRVPVVVYATPRPPTEFGDSTDSSVCEEEEEGEGGGREGGGGEEDSCGSDVREPSPSRNRPAARVSPHNRRRKVHRQAAAAENVPGMGRPVRCSPDVDAAWDGECFLPRCGSGEEEEGGRREEGDRRLSEGGEGRKGGEEEEWDAVCFAPGPTRSAPPLPPPSLPRANTEAVWDSECYRPCHLPMQASSAAPAPPPPVDAAVDWDTKCFGVAPFSAESAPLSHQQHHASSNEAREDVWDRQCFPATNTSTRKR